MHPESAATPVGRFNGNAVIPPGPLTGKAGILPKSVRDHALPCQCRGWLWGCSEALDRACCHELRSCSHPSSLTFQQDPDELLSERNTDAIQQHSRTHGQPWRRSLENPYIQTPPFFLHWPEALSPAMPRETAAQTRRMQRRRSNRPGNSQAKGSASLSHTLKNVWTPSSAGHTEGASEQRPRALPRESLRSRTEGASAAHVAHGLHP